MSRQVQAEFVRALEAQAHVPEVQETIRREIARGTLRVAPTPDGAIRIVPLSAPEQVPNPFASARDTAMGPNDSPEPSMRPRGHAPGPARAPHRSFATARADGPRAGVAGRVDS